MRGKSLSLLLLGILIALVAIYVVGPKDVLNEVSRLSPKHFVVLLLLQVSVMILQAVKWKVACRKIKIGFSKILTISFVGFLVNNVTPVSMTSGEPVRAYVLAKLHDIPIEETSASVIIDLFFQVLPALALVMIGVIVGLTYGAPVAVMGVMILGGLLVAVLALFALGLLVNEQLSKSVIRGIINIGMKFPLRSIRKQAEYANGKLEQISRNFRSALSTTMRDRNTVLAGIIISTLAWTLSFMRTYVAFMAIGVYIPFHVLVLVRVTVVIISFLSLIPGEMGIWEGSSTWLYTFFGIGAPVAMAATIVDRIVSYWFGSLIGLLATAYLGVGYVVKQRIIE